MKNTIILRTLDDRPIKRDEKVAPCPTCKSPSVVTPYLRELVAQFTRQKESYVVKCMNCVDARELDGAIPVEHDYDFGVSSSPLVSESDRLAEIDRNNKAFYRRYRGSFTAKKVRTPKLSKDLFKDL